jgi:hypothetical protein
MHLLLRPLFTIRGTQTLSNWRPVATLMKYDVAEFYKCFDSNFFCIVRTINMATNIY